MDSLQNDITDACSSGFEIGLNVSYMTSTAKILNDNIKKFKPDKKFIITNKPGISFFKPQTDDDFFKIVNSNLIFVNLFPNPQFWMKIDSDNKCIEKKIYTSVINVDLDNEYKINTENLSKLVLDIILDKDEMNDSGVDPDTILDKVSKFMETIDK